MQLVVWRQDIRSRLDISFSCGFTKGIIASSDSSVLVKAQKPNLVSSHRFIRLACRNRDYICSLQKETEIVRGILCQRLVLYRETSEISIHVSMLYE